MSTFHMRKAKRTAYFFNHVYKNKLVNCVACNGSGWYDNTDHHGNSIPCGGCEGTGKCRQR